MKLSQCAAFVAIADTGSFTAAARVLDVSQSAVSHAISTLETELGVGLMKRDRSGVRLTDVGQRVLRHARGVIQHAESMRNVAVEFHDDLRGTVRLGTSQSFACRLLPALLTELRHRFPALEIELRDGTDMQITEWVREYEVDVGIVVLPKPELTTIPLLHDRMYAVLPAAHPLLAGTAVSVRQLAQEEILLPVGAMEAMVTALFEAEGLSPRIVHRVHDLNALLAMVAAGHGLTLVPSLAMPVLSQELRALPLTPVVTRELGIAVGSRVRDQRASKAFVATARALAAQQDWMLPPKPTGV
ncbi:LysR family transcriptional regulator [Streptomyces sp. PR69]|uniref:LysR family transcriptional regulator n=1 Tax=Streptomyces sp. PR69 TaxID=2984950 RepID=UPI002263F9B2|nr:LysR family transcriptional regulator [Streptomyces sp. PR69]